MIQKFPCLYAMTTKGIKKKIGQKVHDMNLSEILNSYFFPKFDICEIS